MHDSLLARIERAAAGDGTVTFVSGDTEVTVSWAQLHEDAKAMAAVLQQRGIGPGDHVAMLSPTTRPLVTAIEAVWLTGATIVLLPLPMRMASIDDFVAGTRQRATRADVSLLLLNPQLAEFVQPAPGHPALRRSGDGDPALRRSGDGDPALRRSGDGDPPMLGIDELADEAAAIGAARYRRPKVDADRLAILQFTSGSTAEPKGVMLPERTLLANLDAIVEAGRLQDDDVFVSWLPLYHDMGLVGMLTVPMTIGKPLVLGAPQDFLGSPARWMRWISDHRGTITAGPNFSWVLATRALRRMDDLDLSSLRIALNGAEPVDASTVHAFVAEASRFGMKPGAVFPAFGMAEVCIGGTFPEPGSGLRTDHVDRAVLEAERYAAPAEPGSPHARQFARLGRPVPGLEIRVVDTSDGRPLADREVGELEIRGTSVTSGYYRDPDATAALFHDGWLRTGDLAYLLDGELVLCGRIKDVIIIGGRNIFPDDIERAVGELEGIRAGNVIAFGVTGERGKEHVVVVAETKADDVDELTKVVHLRAKEVAGAPPHDVVLVSPGTLPKTSSGKLQRSLCKQRYLERQLQPA